MGDESPESIASQLESELRQFTGGLNRWRHPVNRRVIYTEGIKHLVDRGGAHWLIDAIASWIGSKEFCRAAASDPRIESISFWNLLVSHDRSAVLTARADSDEKPFITQGIAFTDFALSGVDIWCGRDAEYWVLFLPSEY
jgi:hypothetical protein